MPDAVPPLQPPRVPALRVLVTRPADQAAEWVAWLTAHGADAVALPLIHIAPPPDPAALCAAWATLSGWDCVAFVSPNAATQFFAARPAGLVWPAGLWAASPGPGTSHSLRALGVPAFGVLAPAADAPQFDTESLWQQLQHHDWRGRRVLIVRGEGGRTLLADLWREAGATVDFVCAYQRQAPPPCAASDALLQAARAAPATHLWFFSSSESVDHLLAWCPALNTAAASALATHPRIAQRAREAGFGRVIAARPTRDAVWACLQSLAS